MKSHESLTKIVCTIGPASEKKEVLEAMIKSGMDIARLNFSHGSHEWHYQTIINLRHAAYNCGRNIGIMADLQGPRVRIDSLEEKNTKVPSINFEKGEKILLKEKKVPRTLPGYLEKFVTLDSQVPLIVHLQENDKVFLDNGMVELVAKQQKYPGGWEMEVQNSGTISTRKGINFPTLAKFIPSFTSKDIKDLEFAVNQGLDFIALSFVKEAKDIINLRKKIQNFLGKGQDQPLIIAKIETLTALHNLKEILEVVDAIMVARGDLGVEAPPEKVPIYQKLLLRHCIKKGIPAIVATNMLESMVSAPRPTRAELTDVANAVIDRADSVMLSGESASGKYPILSVDMMNKIIKATENSPYDDLNRIEELDKRRKRQAKNLEEMTAQAIYNLAFESKPNAIIVENTSPHFIGFLSSLRPPCPIISYFGNHDPWIRKIVVFWGVFSLNSKSSLLKALAEEKHFIHIKGKQNSKGWEFKVKIKQEEFKQEKPVVLDFA